MACGVQFSPISDFLSHFPLIIHADNQFLLVGSGDGSFSVLCDPEVRMRLLYSAIQRTPLLGSLGQ